MKTYKTVKRICKLIKKKGLKSNEHRNILHLKVNEYRDTVS